MPNQWSAFCKVMKRYFHDYGGVRGVLASPIFFISLIITLINYSQWWTEAKWISKSKSLIPSLLGFSLGTYAVLFSLISSKLRETLAEVKSNNGVSYLASVNATFIHFIIIQVVALSWAFLYEGTLLRDVFKIINGICSYADIVFVLLSLAGSFIGYLLLVYSFLLTIAASIAVYRLALIKGY